MTDFWDHQNNGSIAYTDTLGTFKNGMFCATVDTWTGHHTTYFEGGSDGSWYWEYLVTKWGGCTELLHYEYIAETP